MRPEFITFTGADERTDLRRMIALSAQYPIEWGILFSPKRQGRENRYPAIHHIEWMLDNAPSLRYAAHLCGQDARDVLERGKSQYDELLNHFFTRVQINTTQHVDTLAVKEWADALSLHAIVQCRASFPDDANVEWLFDKSGGRGIEQTIWPQPPAGRRVGFAGGLGPANVAQAIGTMTAGVPDARYWIDMESGLRDPEDRFTLHKCRLVCEAVYGSAIPGVKVPDHQTFSP
jgi:hypothetical protein